MTIPSRILSVVLALGCVGYLIASVVYEAKPTNEVYPWLWFTAASGLSGVLNSALVLGMAGFSAVAVFAPKRSWRQRSIQVVLGLAVYKTIWVLLGANGLQSFQFKRAAVASPVAIGVVAAMAAIVSHAGSGKKGEATN